MRFRLGDFDPVAVRLTRWLGPLFAGPFMAVATTLMVLTGIAVGLRMDGLWNELTRVIDRGIWLPLLAIYVVAKLWHESGHAVAARRFGVRVGDCGVMLFLLAPMAYVDVTDAWQLSSRRRRVAIALGGVYFELLAATIAALVWMMCDGLVGHLAAQCVLIMGPATLLVNANPLLRLDGYYVVSDALDIPNLRSHGRSIWVALADRWLLNLDHEPIPLHGWRFVVAALHAAASILFQFVWMTGLVIATWHWAEGLGAVLAVLAIAYWAILPAVRMAVTRWSRLNLWMRCRMVLSFGSLVMVIQWGLSQPSPMGRRVPVAVRYRNEQIVRAPVDAFVESVPVRFGRRVETGQVLIRLINDELYVRRNETASDLELAKMDADVAAQSGEAAAAIDYRRIAESLQRRLTTLDEQIDDLTLTARRSGRIVTPQIEQMIGRHIESGTPVMRVAESTEKEFVVSIDEASLGAYQDAVQKRRWLPVRLRGGASATIQPVPPRADATTQLPSAALGATAGGPIPVRPSSTDAGAMVTDRPRLTAVIPMSRVDAATIAAGRVGSIRIGDDRSLGRRIFDAIFDVD